MPKNGDGPIIKNQNHIGENGLSIYTKDGVIAHHSDYRTITQQIDLQNLDPSEYVTERIYENEFVEPAKFFPVRFRIVKKSNSDQA